MAFVPIKMPQLGESIAEATIVRLLFKEGDSIQADADLIEVETNKAMMAVTAPCSGVITEILAENGTSYPVGAILGQIEVSAEEAKRLGLDEPEKTSRKPAKKRSDTPPAPQKVEPTVPSGLPVPAHAGGVTYLSPRMKARMSELGLRAADLAGIARGANPENYRDRKDRF
jgi:pyruvate/2-oxoglutarate dehydrogenase complex dihydrolipoamide acyltransferase (E2) component